MTEALDKARVACRRLKVFPLPPVVLLPGAAVPLHIFEPRYRELVKDALESDGIFALAQVMPGQEALLAGGTPALEDLLCVGVIGPHEALEDGRYNLVLVGLARARLLREHPRARLYREVEAELLEDAPVDEALEAGLRQAVLELIARVPTEVGQRLAQVTSRVGGGALADVVASTFMQDAAQRFDVLRETDVAQRVQAVTDELLGIVGQLKPRKADTYMN